MPRELNETYFSESITIKELLDLYPFLLSTFIDLGLMCVGCPTDAFHNLSDVAREHDLDKKHLITQLKSAINAEMSHKTKH
jgi:hybrid cluster-associated redox disulfide protein